AAVVAEALDGADALAVDARLVAQLLIDVMEQGDRLVRGAARAGGQPAGQRGDLFVVGPGLGIDVQVFARVRRRVERAAQLRHGGRGPVDVDGAVDRAAGAERPVADAGPLRPEHLPAVGVARVGRPVEQLDAAAVLAQDVLPAEVQGRGGLQPGIPLAGALD